MVDKPRVMVTCDDIGYCSCRNAGALSCARSNGGAVTNASVLVTMEGALDAARRESWGGEGQVVLGLHLNLSEGKPLAERHVLRTLLDGDGRFFNKFELRKRCEEGLVQQDELVAEIAAQLERFHQLFGRLPIYVDGHQHVHLISCVVQVLARLMAGLGIWRVRIPRERVTADKHPWISTQQRSFFEWVYEASLAAMAIFREHRIRFTDKFVGLSFQGEAFSLERLWMALEPLQPGETVEVMTHCGYACTQNHGDDFNASPQRDVERLALMDGALSEKFQLISFADI